MCAIIDGHCDIRPLNFNPVNIDKVTAITYDSIPIDNLFENSCFELTWILPICDVGLVLDLILIQILG